MCLGRFLQRTRFNIMNKVLLWLNESMEFLDQIFPSSQFLVLIGWGKRRERKVGFLEPGARELT
jgi:hypothetical protein